MYTEIQSYDTRGRNGNVTIEDVVNQSFKNYTTNTVWTLEDKESVVKEEMNLFNWELSSDSEIILGYVCRKAESEFRGRKYEAWFTTDLSFRATPWKIHALPGVVLKVKVDTNYYVLETIDLAVKEPTEKIESPFNSKKILSWNEYLIVYKSD